MASKVAAGKTKSTYGHPPAGLTRRRAKRLIRSDKPHKKKQRWWGDTFVYGKDSKPYMVFDDAFRQRRDDLLRMCAEQLKVGEIGPLVEGKTKEGQPIIMAYAYRGF